MSDYRESYPDHSGSPVDEQLWSSFIGIAIDLHARTAAEIASLSPGDIENRFASTLRKAEENLGREMVDAGIEGKIDELPGHVILSICAEVLGDDRVLEPLLRIGEVRRKEAEREALLAEISYEAKNSWRFDFRKVPKDEIVKVGFFKPSLERFEQSVDFAHRAGRTITARMVEPESGSMEVIADVRNPGSNFRMEDQIPPLVDYAKISIGVPVPSKSNRYSNDLSPVVTHGTSCTLETEKNWWQMKYDIGYITVGGVVALSAPQS
jgi:hypothetical protein